MHISAGLIKRERERKRHMLTHYMLRERDSEGEDNTQKFIGMERDRDTERTRVNAKRERTTARGNDRNDRQ